MVGQNLQNENNSFMVEKRQRKKLPNAILTFFFIMQLVYGLNFGFIGLLNKNIRHYCKGLSLLVCIYTSITLLSSAHIFSSQWDTDTFMGLLFLVQYCGHIFFLYFAKYKVYHFITDMRSIDDGIVHAKEHKIGFFACIVFGSWFVIIIIIYPVVCTVYTMECSFKNPFFTIMYFIPTTGLDAIVLVQLIVNLYTYYAVIYLVGLVGTEKTSLIRQQFLRVSECCEKFEGHYGNLVAMELLIQLPKYIILICDFLYNVKENAMWKVYLFELMSSTYVLLQMCAPAVVVEGINKQMENLKYELYTRLMEEKDIDKHLELSSLLRYMEQKPLYSNAWRVIPVDINLVVVLFGFTTTNIIVIIQFMHIY